MGYEYREFDTELHTSLEDIDKTITEALATAVPSRRYAVRDVVYDAGNLVVVEHKQATPITPATQYREVRERRPLEIIGAVDPPGLFAPATAHLKIARWYNQDIFVEYREQSFGESLPAYRGLLNASVATFEMQYLVPRPVTEQERDRYHPEHHGRLVGFAEYDLYTDDDSSYRTINFVVPDFRKLFAERRAELSEIVVAYDRDPQEFARNKGMDLFRPDKDEQILLYEIEQVMLLSVVREQSLVEAVHEYLSEGSLQCSREMTLRSYGDMDTVSDWQTAHELLKSFVAQIRIQP